MKIYWKKLIWNYTIRYWWKLIHLTYCVSCKNSYIKKLVNVKDAKHKRDIFFWDNYHSKRDKKIWNSKQEAKCLEAWASFLPKLDDLIRKTTARDNAITTVISTQANQKMYKGGKVIAMRKSLSNQTNKGSDQSTPYH